MNKNRTIIVVATAIVLLFFLSCNKDLRDKYIGDWEFVVERLWIYNEYPDSAYTSLDTVYDYLGTATYTSSDVIYYTGKISMVSKFEPILTIQFVENEEINAYLDNKGYLWETYPSPYTTCHQCGLGYFEKKDKIFLEFTKNFYPEKFRIDYNINGRRKKG